MNRIIDSHVHLGLLYKYNPERIDWLISNGCSVISWAFGGNIGSVSDMRKYLDRRRTVFDELRRQGFDCYYLCGIHPRKIPPDLQPEKVGELLTPFLDNPQCLGIGEIGLETDSPREVEILCAQVEFGLSLGRSNLRFGIHTPRRRKEVVTHRLLNILTPYEKTLAPLAVIDHCTKGIIDKVLSRGYHAGISLSANKSSEDELAEMMGFFGKASHRILCNTDSGREFFEDFVNASRSGKIEKDIAENIFFGTAARFFGIEEL